MSAKCDDPFARVKTGDEGGFIPELTDLYGATCDIRVGIDNPHAGGFPIVVEGTERHFQRLGHLPLGDPDCDSCAQRGTRSLAIKHVTRLVGPRRWIGRIRELSQDSTGRRREGSISPGLRLRANRRAHGLWQVHYGLARTRPSELHHGLASAHHLARFGQTFHDGAVSVGAQD